MKRQLSPLTNTLTSLLASLAVLPAALAEEQRTVPDTYRAVTTQMTPAEVELKADIIRWSTDDERAAVIAALGKDEGIVDALRALPTVGVVWREGSSVGHSIKYAHRETLADGSETITLVTDRRIGSTSFTPWQADEPVRETPLDYSVVEMTTGGTGSLSLAADIAIDTNRQLVSLDETGHAPVLTNIRKDPKPYWADSR